MCLTQVWVHFNQWLLWVLSISFRMWSLVVSQVLSGGMNTLPTVRHRATYISPWAFNRLHIIACWCTVWHMLYMHIKWQYTQPNQLDPLEMCLCEIPRPSPPLLCNIELSNSVNTRLTGKYCYNIIIYYYLQDMFRLSPAAVQCWTQPHISWLVSGEWFAFYFLTFTAASGQQVEITQANFDVKKTDQIADMYHYWCDWKFPC